MGTVGDHDVRQAIGIDVGDAHGRVAGRRRVEIDPRRQRPARRRRAPERPARERRVPQAHLAGGTADEVGHAVAVHVEDAPAAIGHTAGRGLRAARLVLIPAPRVEADARILRVDQWVGRCHRGLGRSGSPLPVVSVVEQRERLERRNEVGILERLEEVWQPVAVQIGEPLVAAAGGVEKDAAGRRFAAVVQRGPESHRLEVDQRRERELPARELVVPRVLRVVSGEVDPVLGIELRIADVREVPRVQDAIGQSRRAVEQHTPAPLLVDRPRVVTIGRRSPLRRHVPGVAGEVLLVDEVVTAVAVDVDHLGRLVVCARSASHAGRRRQRVHGAGFLVPADSVEVELVRVEQGGCEVVLRG